MQRERIERMAMRREVTAALNALLGRRADAALAEPAAPPLLVVEDRTLAAALQGLDRGTHPALQASTAMAAAAAARTTRAVTFRMPPPEFLFLHRRLSGVFVMLAALRAEFNAGAQVVQALERACAGD